MYLTADRDTVIPAMALIRQLGYHMTIDHTKPSFRADKDGNVFEGEDPVVVLGLIKLFEMRGENWAATDQELETIVRDMLLNGSASTGEQE